jgi:hypothetical protein
MEVVPTEQNRPHQFANLELIKANRTTIKQLSLNSPRLEVLFHFFRVVLDLFDIYVVQLFVQSFELEQKEQSDYYAMTRFIVVIIADCDALGLKSSYKESGGTTVPEMIKLRRL